MSLEFKTNISSAEAEAKIRALQEQIGEVEEKLAIVEAQTGLTWRQGTMVVQDLATILDIAADAGAIQLSATQQLAINMIQMGAMAARHIASLWSKNPLLAPYAIIFYASTMLMEIEATRDISERGQLAQQQFRTAQQLMRIGMSYGGIF